VCSWRYPMPDQDWSDCIAQAGATPNAPGYEQVRQRILDAAHPAAGEVAADVGAGLGLLTFALA
ncbi:MAG: hypothetical protein ACTHMU_10450, partial [Thermomicrobiales bacterium]